MAGRNSLIYWFFVISTFLSISIFLVSQLLIRRHNYDLSSDKLKVFLSPIKSSIESFNSTYIANRIPYLLHSALEQLHSRVELSQPQSEEAPFKSLIMRPLIRHPAVPVEEDKENLAIASESPSAEDGMTCQVSFPEKCSIYPYIRYWNKRFFPEDCYESPLRHPMKNKAPFNEQKYVVFEPDRGGNHHLHIYIRLDFFSYCMFVYNSRLFLNYQAGIILEWLQRW